MNFRPKIPENGKSWRPGQQANEHSAILVSWNVVSFIDWVYGETNFGADESGTLVGTGRLEVRPTNLQVGPLEFGKKTLGCVPDGEGKRIHLQYKFPEGLKLRCNTS